MRYFEDLEQGETFELGEETLAREDVVEFAEQFDPQPFHLGEAGAEGSVFDGHVASGLHTLSLGSRMLVEGVLLDADNMGGRGISSIEFTNPVYPGDTLEGEAEIVEKQSNSRTDGGDVDFRLTLTNQDGDPVVSAVFHTIIGYGPDSEGER